MTTGEHRDLVLQCRVLVMNEDGGEYVAEMYWCGGVCPPIAKVTSDLGGAPRYTLRSAMNAIGQIKRDRPHWLLAIDARTLDEVTVAATPAALA